MRLFSVFSVCLLAAQVCAANFPLGTLIVSGSVKNYLNELYEGNGDVQVQAASTNGVVLAECTVRKASTGSDGENYLLEIPMTSVATGSSIAPGDEVRLYVVDENGLKVAAGTVSSLKAIGELRVDLRVVDVTKFDSNSPYADADGKVAVANEYLDLWESYTGSRNYRPDADEDGDGASNYFEYLAGTNPFDDSDALRIRAFSVDAAEKAAITFEYVGGHVYSVLSTTSLATPAWAVKETVLPATAEAEPGETTIYVVPTESSTSRFFRLDPQ